MCNDPAMSTLRPERHEVVVLALPDVQAFEIGLASRFLGWAVDGNDRRLYRVRVATLDGGPVRTSGGYSVLPEHDASIVSTAQTLVVPAVHGGPAMTEGTLPDEVTALLRQAAGSARLVSLCTGAFVLAAAGLLDGRPATTHWLYTDAFRRLYPAVHLDPDVLFVDDGDVLTSAGNAAGIDLLLHLLRRDHGTEVANRVARRSVVAPWREGGQSQFIERPVPVDGATGTAATRAWAVERLERPPDPRRVGRPRPDERPDVHPPLPRRDRHLPAAVAGRPAPRPGTAAARVHRLPGGPGRLRRRFRDGRLAPGAAPRLDRRLAAHLPAHVPGSGRSPLVTGNSRAEGAGPGDLWLSGIYRRRPRSSGAAGIDVGLRLRHRGAPGCPTSR